MAADKTCTKCNGKGKIPCPGCSGKRTTVRSINEGRTQLSKIVNCACCNGKSTVTCGKCDGKGIT